MKTLRLLTGLVACTAGLFAAEPTVAEAKTFLDNAEKRLFDLSLDSNQASWVQSTYITDDTEAVAARANERSIAEAVRLAKGAVRFDKLTLPPDMRRRAARSRAWRHPSKEPTARASIVRKLNPAQRSRAWTSKPSRASWRPAM